MTSADPVHPAATHISLRDQIARLIGIAPERMMRSRCRPWSSLSFAGTRHEYVFACESPIDDGAPGRIKAHEFALDGEIVADASLAFDGRGYRVEALTVEAQ